MKYLICGDIHGNLPALEKLLEVENNNYDIFVSHGDVVNYGPWSNECVVLLNTLPNAVKLMGNHEENFIAGSYSGTHPVARAFFDFCYPKFINRELILDYEKFVSLKTFIVTHTILEQYIFPDTDLEKIELKNNYIIGHSHYQYEREVNGKKLVNTGSLGQNRKYINLAEYIIFDDIKNKIELKSFEFKIDTVINQMKEEKYPSICIDYYSNKKRKLYVRKHS